MNISCHHPESRTFLVSWLCMYLCMHLHMLKRRGRRRENTCTTWNPDKDVVALRTQLQAFSGHPACYLDAEIWTMVLTIPISTTELSLQSHHSPFKSICAFALSGPNFFLTTFILFQLETALQDRIHLTCKYQLSFFMMKWNSAHKVPST